MPQYNGLKYKTRGNASPQGRPRVFFCCHPDDFQTYFETISDEILNRQTNAAIWYYNPSEMIPEGEEFLLDLSQMQLFVVPVTGKFVYQNSQARQVEFQYAVEHHIPILPLMQEAGLEADFNRVCGDIQLLDKTNNDPTAIPYDEKLKKLLESVLVSDELAKQVRDAFDAYIFLSYRKKDRKHAQQIMHLIHENELFRDVAIWYDEFLAPGENFTDAIAAAMKKCELVALTVTPNLLENPNYVMDVEYPEAKKTGKSVLPLEIVETDHNELGNFYDGIDGITNTDDPEAVSAELMKVLREFVISENDGDAKHLFFIGLAYLSGIDVEVDHEKALSLITKAADGDLPDAYEKLVSMYNNGEGVERNYYTAAQMQEQYVEMLQRTLVDPYETRAIIAALKDLGAMWLSLEKLNEAKNAYIRMLDHSVRRNEIKDTLESRRDLAVSYFKLGDVSKAEGKPAEAKEYYKKDLALCEEIARTSATSQSRRDLTVTYNRLGSISEAEGNLSEAKEYYLKSLANDEASVKEDGTIENRRDLSISYQNLGEISRAEGHLSEANEYFQKALEIREALAKESGTITSRRDLSVAYSKLGNISETEGNLSEAKEYYLKSLAIDKELAEESGTIISRRNLSVTYVNLGDISKAEGNLSEAREYYQKALEIREEIARESKTIKSRRSLSVAYMKLGNVSKADGNLGEANEYYQKALEIREEIARESGTIMSRRDLSVAYFKFGNARMEEGNLSEAKEYYRKSLSIDEELARENEDIESRRDLSLSYYKLGNVSKAEGNLSEAKEYYRKSLAIDEELAKGKEDIESRRDLSLSYYKLGDICMEAGNLSEAKEYFQKSLELREAIAQESGTMQSYEDLVISYCSVGNLGDRKLLKKSYDLARKMEPQYPQSAVFADFKNLLKPYVGIKGFMSSLKK